MYLTLIIVRDNKKNPGRWSKKMRDSLFIHIWLRIHFLTAYPLVPHSLIAYPLVNGLSTSRPCINFLTEYALADCVSTIRLRIHFWMRIHKKTAFPLAIDGCVSTCWLRIHLSTAYPLYNCVFISLLRIYLSTAYPLLDCVSTFGLGIHFFTAYPLLEFSQAAQAKDTLC